MREDHAPGRAEMLDGLSASRAARRHPELETLYSHGRFLLPHLRSTPRPVRVLCAILCFESAWQGFHQQRAFEAPERCDHISPMCRRLSLLAFLCSCARHFKPSSF